MNYLAGLVALAITSACICFSLLMAREIMKLRIKWVRYWLERERLKHPELFEDEEQLELFPEKGV